MGSPAVVPAGWSGSRARWWSASPSASETITVYASACVPLLASVAGSATGGCMSCCAARASWPTTSSSTGSTRKRSSQSAGVAGRSAGSAACWRAPGARSPPTSAGPWTSPRTAWPTAAGSAPPTSRTTARASARRSWSTSHCRGNRWSACSRMSPANAATRTCWWSTTGPSCAVVTSTAGPMRTG
jgi:hypothetical protein